MTTLFIVPSFESLSSSPISSCQCSGGSTSMHGPIRQRALFRRRWSPFESRLSRFLELAEDERDFSDHTEGLENLWSLPSLFLRGLRSAKKESDSATTKSAEAKQFSEKAQQKLSPEDEKRSDKFSVSVELGDAFEPSEISVKMVGKSLKVEGKHEETGDDGHFSCRQFTRSFYIPDDVDIENFTSVLSKEGVLSVEAPRLQLKEKESEEKNIPIQQTTSDEVLGAEKSEEAEKENKKLEEEEKELKPTENEPDKPKETEKSNKD